MNVSGAVVLLTGSSRGIGLACAEQLARRGALVILHGRSSDLAGNADFALGAKMLDADFREPAAAESLADAALDVYGRVDAIVHSAGFGCYRDAADTPADDVDGLVDVNLRAPLQLTRALLPGMLARGRGHVGFVASIAGLTGVAHESVYAATKAGLVTFAESIGAELMGTGVGVSVVSPAAVRTDFFDRRGAAYGRRFPRMVTPDRVARAMVRSIERGSGNCTVPRWVSVAPVVRSAAPGLFRTLNGRFG